MKNQKGFIGLPGLIAIILGVILLGSGAYFVMQKSRNRINMDTEIVHQCPDGQIPFGGLDSNCSGHMGKLIPSHPVIIGQKSLVATSSPITIIETVPAVEFKLLGLGQTIPSDEGNHTGYTRDATGVYVVGFNGRGSEVLGADANTFEVNTKWPIYARDNTHVYVYGKIIPGADPGTFVAMCGYSMQSEAFCAYGKDTKHVYAYTQIVPGADPSTFVSLVSNNDTNKNSAGKTWVDSAIDASSYYADYLPSQYGDFNSKLSGVRLSKLSDGSLLHFSDTSKVVAISPNSSSWGGYYEGVKIGPKSYYGGTYLVDGATVYTLYSACDVDISGKESNCTNEVLSRVDKVGDRPREVTQ